MQAKLPFNYTWTTLRPRWWLDATNVNNNFKGGALACNKVEILGLPRGCLSITTR